ncbi:hypothetical protein [Nesterenkonia flava]|uniref:Uncharacterized protein n=1 Tax=Nesterenkonia flava TaxID=469799 RepID=A0ABU1FRT8_9MICC|nr:hypothetical protein [Nesterenkonia flava]MDR5711380.1 hypothetical protein [Nesterenkonia flava]
MTQGVLSFPFRFTPQGSAAIAPFGSDQEVEEAIAVLTLTKVGERVMEPDFGINDPTWNGISPGDIETGLSTYGPEGIQVEDVEEQVISETQSAYSVRWAREEVEDEAV